jgi:hypothetical protein
MSSNIAMISNKLVDSVKVVRERLPSLGDQAMVLDVLAPHAPGILDPSVHSFYPLPPKLWPGWALTQQGVPKDWHWQIEIRKSQDVADRYDVRFKLHPSPVARWNALPDWVTYLESVTAREVENVLRPEAGNGPVDISFKRPFKARAWLKIIRVFLADGNDHMRVLFQCDSDGPDCYFQRILAARLRRSPPEVRNHRLSGVKRRRDWNAPTHQLEHTAASQYYEETAKSFGNHVPNSYFQRLGKTQSIPKGANGFFGSSRVPPEQSFRENAVERRFVTTPQLRLWSSPPPSPRAGWSYETVYGGLVPMKDNPKWLKSKGSLWMG